MNDMTRCLLAPDGDWSSIHLKLGCHGCRFALRDQLDCDFCCSHPEGMLVNLSLECLHRKKKQRYVSAKTRQTFTIQR
jgi:hypothetical protein